MTPHSTEWPSPVPVRRADIKPQQRKTVSVGVAFCVGIVVGASFFILLTMGEGAPQLPSMMLESPDQGNGKTSGGYLYRSKRRGDGGAARNDADALATSTLASGRMATPVTPAPGQPRVAVLFFGLTRSLRMVYDDMRTHLLDRIPPHDVFLHTYHLKSPLVNPRAGEVNVTLNATEFRLAHPLAYEVEDQDIVDRTLPFDAVAKQGMPYGKTGELLANVTLLNILRQLHSLHRVHTLMHAHMERAGVTYDWVVLTRPELSFKTSLNWSIVNTLEPNQYVVPNFGHYRGVNDRFMIGRLDAARAFAERFRLARCFSAPLHSETFLRLAMERDGFQPVETNILFTRMRSNGEEEGDHYDGQHPPRRPPW